MKQKYYSLSHQASGADIWVSTMSANRDYIEAVRSEVLASGKKAHSIKESEFDNYFVKKTWGPGSEYTTFDYDSFVKLGESHTCRQESAGNFYCVRGFQDNEEVKKAVADAMQEESRRIDRYYSQPWV